MSTNLTRSLDSFSSRLLVRTYGIEAELSVLNLDATYPCRFVAGRAGKMGWRHAASPCGYWE